MLLSSNKHSARDLERWRLVERTAAVHAKTAMFARRSEEARRALVEFLVDGAGYCGVSWGKDSVVVAHMVSGLVPSFPLVWVRVEPVANPECALVRDAFLAAHTCCYDEIATTAARGVDRSHTKALTSGAGFEEAARRYGDRHVSGVRAEESGRRKIGILSRGLTTHRTCSPLGRWTAGDVWAYLLSHDLPVHPAYAYTLDGALDPGRIRVGALGGHRGTGMGRAEWEERYYGERLADISRNF